MYSSEHTAVLNVVSNCVIISVGQRARCFALVAIRCYVTISVRCHFLTVPWVGLHCLIVAFPGHTHFLARLILTCVVYS